MSRNRKQPKESPSDSPIVALGFLIVLMIAYWIATDEPACEGRVVTADATCQVQADDAD